MSADNMVRRSVQERGVVALERIADALEAANASDPLTMLSAALGDAEGPQDAPEGEAMTAMSPTLAAALSDRSDPLGWFATNGATYMYEHPTRGWHIVLRRDKTAESGYAVSVEKAE